jgi:hypothetical protein
MTSRRKGLRESSRLLRATLVDVRAGDVAEVPARHSCQSPSSIAHAAHSPDRIHIPSGYAQEIAKRGKARGTKEAEVSTRNDHGGSPSESRGPDDEAIDASPRPQDFATARQLVTALASREGELFHAIVEETMGIAPAVQDPVALKRLIGALAVTVLDTVASFAWANEEPDSEEAFHARVQEWLRKVFEQQALSDQMAGDSPDDEDDRVFDLPVSERVLVRVVGGGKAEAREFLKALQRQPEHQSFLDPQKGQRVILELVPNSSNFLIDDTDPDDAIVAVFTRQNDDVVHLGWTPPVREMIENCPARDEDEAPWREEP